MTETEHYEEAKVKQEYTNTQETRERGGGDTGVYFEPALFFCVNTT